MTFSIPACQTTYNSTASTAVTPTSATAGNVLGAAAAVKKISNTKASVLVPALPIAVSGAANQRYNVCFYASTSSTAAIIGNAVYTVAVAPVIPAAAPNASPPTSPVSPSKGPALGGTRVTVTATSGLPITANSITATLGGEPMTQVTPVSATSFTAVTPAHAPGVVSLVVTTAAGSQTISSAFTYANGITVEPNTAPNTSTAVVLDVLGAGFNNYTFGSAATNARVWLVDGTYTPGATGASAYTTGPSAECTGVVTVSDNEVICTLNLTAGLTSTSGATSGNPVPNGTYTVVVVSNGDFGASDLLGYAVSDLSSGATFTVADY